jgi:hypothetical protein
LLIEAFEVTQIMRVQLLTLEGRYHRRNLFALSTHELV